MAHDRRVAHCSRACANADSLSTRRRMHDPSLFSAPLADVSAYVLGLIFSDGCLSLDRCSGIWRVTLAMNDEGLIRRVHGLMCDPRRRVYRRGRSWALVSTNAADVAFLRSMGVTPRKSLTIGWPGRLPTGAFWPFVRGVLDGDGTVTTEYRRSARDGLLHARCNVSIVSGSPAFAEALAEHLTARGVCASTFTDARGVAHVHVSRQPAVAELARRLYAGAELWLDRKRALFATPAELPCPSEVTAQLSAHGVIGWARLRGLLGDDLGKVGLEKRRRD